MAVKRIILIALIILSVCLNVSAESILTGTVTNGRQVPFDFVSVTASPYHSPKNIIASAFTDDKGEFS